MGSMGGLGRRRWFLRDLALGLMVGVLSLTATVGHSQAPLFLGVTTSTENSGLLAHLIEAFEVEHGIKVRAVTAGTGAVLNLAARGDVDVVLVHAPEDEEHFVRAGYGVDRRPVMRNRFVIVGPKTDPAAVGEQGDVGAAFAAIAANEALFLSRGDESGTHRAERKIWDEAAIDPEGTEDSAAGKSWYRESGSGQGATLNIAANIGAYTLTDEATWATFGNPGELKALFSKDDPALRNIYNVIRVNPDRHAGLNAEDALTFVDWLTSKAGQNAITGFRAGGRVLFQPVRGLAG